MFHYYCVVYVWIESTMLGQEEAGRPACFHHNGQASGYAFKNNLTAAKEQDILAATIMG